MPSQSLSPVIRFLSLGLMTISLAACAANASQQPVYTADNPDESWSYPDSSPKPTPTPVAGAATTPKPPPVVREVPPSQPRATRPAPVVRDSGTTPVAAPAPRPVDPQRGEQTYYLVFNDFDGMAYDHIERGMMSADAYYRGLDQSRSTPTAVYATYRTGLSTSEMRRLFNSLRDRSNIGYSISSNGHNFTITRRAVRR